MSRIHTVNVTSRLKKDFSRLGIPWFSLSVFPRQRRGPSSASPGPGLGQLSLRTSGFFSAPQGGLEKHPLLKPLGPKKKTEYTEVAGRSQEFQKIFCLWTQLQKTKDSLQGLHMKHCCHLAYLAGMKTFEPSILDGSSMKIS